jgi:hypothetical protein
MTTANILIKFLLVLLFIYFIKDFFQTNNSVEGYSSLSTSTAASYDSSADSSNDQLSDAINSGLDES